MKGNRIIVTEEIENKIFTIRGVQVMIDRDLAELYQVETRVLNQAVKRNIERFPKEFMFQLTKAEYENLISQTAISNHILKSQSVISNEHGGRRKLPYAFTEQGVSMLSAVLRSNIAIQVSIQIINAFVSMRKIISSNKIVFDRLDRIELKQLKFESNFEEIFQLLENKDTNLEKGILFEGQFFDAHTFISDLIRGAKYGIILIDNYVDDRTLSLFTKIGKGVQVRIYTKNISSSLKNDLKKFILQYGNFIEVIEFDKSHDRFLIIDEKDVYHIGASLKDLGKKWCGFSKFDREVLEILEKLK